MPTEAQELTLQDIHELLNQRLDQFEQNQTLFQQSLEQLLIDFLKQLTEKLESEGSNELQELLEQLQKTLETVSGQLTDQASTETQLISSMANLTEQLSTFNPGN